MADGDVEQGDVGGQLKQFVPAKLFSAEAYEATSWDGMAAPQSATPHWVVTTTAQSESALHDTMLYFDCSALRSVTYDC